MINKPKTASYPAATRKARLIQFRTTFSRKSTSGNTKTLVKCLWAAPPQFSWNIQVTEVTRKVTGFRQCKSHYVSNITVPSIYCRPQLHALFTNVKNGETFYDWSGDHNTESIKTHLLQSNSSLLAIMTGQTEGDKPGRLKEEGFPSLQYLRYYPIIFLIAKQLQFSELNRTYKYPIFASNAAKQFSNRQQTPPPPFLSIWLSTARLHFSSLRGAYCKEKRLNTKNLPLDFHQMCTLEWLGHAFSWPEGMLQCLRIHGGCTLMLERVHLA